MGTMKKPPAAASLQPHEDVLVKGYRELGQVVPLDRSTIYRQRKRGEFPAPVMLTPTRPAWWLSELRAWLASRKQTA